MKEAKVRKEKVSKSAEASPSGAKFYMETILRAGASSISLAVTLLALLSFLEKSLSHYIPILGIIGSIVAALSLFFRLKTWSVAFYERLFHSLRKETSSIRSSPTAATTAITALARRKAGQRQIATIVLLISLTVYTAVRLRLALPLSFVVVTVLAGACLLFQLADAALGYRVRHGLYGTNEYEARQIISFALSHAEKTDLSGGLGAADINIDAVTESIINENWGVAIS